MNPVPLWPDTLPQAALRLDTLSTRVSTGRPTPRRFTVYAGPNGWYLWCDVRRYGALVESGRRQPACLPAWVVDPMAAWTVAGTYAPVGEATTGDVDRHADRDRHRRSDGAAAAIIRVYNRADSRPGQRSASPLGRGLGPAGMRSRAILPLATGNVPVPPPPPGVANGAMQAARRGDRR